MSTAPLGMKYWREPLSSRKKTLWPKPKPIPVVSRSIWKIDRTEEEEMLGLARVIDSKGSIVVKGYPYKALINIVEHHNSKIKELPISAEEFDQIFTEENEL